jgi:putative transposase
VVTPAAKRSAVGHAVSKHGVSFRRACGLAALSRSSYYYQSHPRNDAELRDALKEVAARRRRFGYRRLTDMLRREGWTDNHKRVYRIYREEELQVRRRRRKRSAKWRGEKPPAVTRPNQRWAMDFVHDMLADSRRLRMLVVLDEFTRECLAIEVDTSLSGERVTRVLDRLVELRGKPEALLTDNGPEFIGKAMDAWAYCKQVRLDFIEPGKPTQNPFVESFNGKFRDECLNEHWFIHVEHARETIETWRCDYNICRPHSSLGKLTPVEFAAQAAAG